MPARKTTKAKKAAKPAPAAPAGAGVARHKTRETSVDLRLQLWSARPQASISTGLPFFDHMLEQTARHGRLRLSLQARGDLAVDAHHTVEDCGLAFGRALAQCVGNKAGLRRFGNAYAPLDESLARVVADLSGRPALVYSVALSRATVGNMDSDLFREFFQAVANAGGVCLHIDLLRGVNAHHQIECVFKAFGLALAAACERVGGGVPSTKGAL